MKILSVYYKHKQGGFNQRLYKLYRALTDRDHHIHYIAASPFPISRTNIDAHVLRIPFWRAENPVFWICFLMMAPLYCLWIAISRNIDKIVVFSGIYAAVCCPTAVLLQRPMIVFLRADVLKESRLQGKSLLKIALHGFLERLGLRFSSLVITNSLILRNTISERQSGLRFDVLPNNITGSIELTTTRKMQIRSRYHLGPDQFLVVAASPFNRVKNIDFLVRAFSKISAPNARLMLVGDDLTGSGERKRLEHLVRQMNLDSQVVFTGWLDEPMQAIAAADMYVTASKQEGSPNSLLEALAINLPCLGSRIPEIEEILRYRELLFDLKSTTELAQKIDQAATDKKYRQKLQRLAEQCKKAYSFDWDQEVANIISLI